LSYATTPSSFFKQIFAARLLTARYYSGPGDAEEKLDSALFSQGDQVSKHILFNG
jgi:hypothetical protein